MAKRLLYIILVSCFLCVSVLFLLGCPKQKKAKSGIIKGVGESSAIEKSTGLGRKEKDFSFLLDKLKQKNPFSKDHVNIDKYKFMPGALNLSGIYYDGKRPLAIINDQVVAEGDTLNDKQVIKISNNEVILKDKEKEYRLRTE